MDVVLRIIIPIEFLNFQLIFYCFVCPNASALYAENTPPYQYRARGFENLQLEF